MGRALTARQPDRKAELDLMGTPKPVRRVNPNRGASINLLNPGQSNTLYAESRS